MSDMTNEDAAWDLLAVACPDLSEGELEDAIPHVAKALAEATRAEREATLGECEAKLLRLIETEQKDPSDGPSAAQDAYNAVFAIRARSAPQAEGKQMTTVSKDAVDAAIAAWRGCGLNSDRQAMAAAITAAAPFLAAPQPPASPSQEGGMREALEEIAKQKLDGEMDDDGPWGSNCDFVEGYEQCVKRARAALAHDGGREG